MHTDFLRMEVSMCMWMGTQSSMSSYKLQRVHVQLCLGIFSPYHKFPGSYLGSEMGPTIWLMVGPTNPCGSVLVHKGPAFPNIHCPILRRIYESFFLNTTSVELWKHWTWAGNCLQDLATSLFSVWKQFFSRVTRKKCRNEANSKEW